MALWLGAMTYIHLRSSSPLFIHWIEVAGFQKLFSLNHHLFLDLPEWLVYSLPSGLWAFAYSIVITGIWWNSKSRLKYFWFATILILVVGWEILQLSGLVHGTYSFGDIITGLVGAALGMYVGIKLIKPKYYEKESN